jgi:ADP-ribosylglycohydrolase
MSTRRTVACLKALASGDALGKQTETLTHRDVRRWYPEGIRGFHGSAGEVIPRYAGNANREWRIGETTDDTEQTLAVARAVLSSGGISHTAVGRELLQRRKSVHSGVKSIWTFQQLGDAGRIATDGNGCGAAMRVSPVGILYPPERREELVRGAYESSIPTHGGHAAVCAAAAVAGAISGAVAGKGAAEVLEIAVECARMAEAFTPGICDEVTMARCIEKVHADLSARPSLNATDIAETQFPDRPETKVPLAISLALMTKSAEQTILLAANVGGDSDSVASIGGAIAGALCPHTVNDDWFAVVQAVNQDDIVAVARALAERRASGGT